jgi:hypothetical protein
VKASTYVIAAAGAGLAVYLGYRWLASRLPAVEPAAAGITPSPRAPAPTAIDDELEVTAGNAPAWATEPPKPIGATPEEFETDVAGATRPGAELFASPTMTISARR